MKKPSSMNQPLVKSCHLLEYQRVINYSVNMKSLIWLIVISFFILDYVTVAIMAQELPTVSPVIKDPAAKLDDIKKSSKLMKIKNYSKTECAKQMKEHIKSSSALWLQADEVMEKKGNTKCENQGGPVEVENVGEDLDTHSGMKIRDSLPAEQIVVCID